MEIFNPIKNFEKLYQISNRGNVKSLPKELYNGHAYFTSKEKILKPIATKSGYLQVNLYKNKKKTPLLYTQINIRGIYRTMSSRKKRMQTFRWELKK